jgi:hypothetical protein
VDYHYPNDELMQRVPTYKDVECIEQIEHHQWDKGNEYYDLFKANRLDVDRFKEWINLGRPPKFNLDDGTRSWLLRYEYVRKYAWAVPAQKAINCLKASMPIVEFGAGSGYWAQLVTGVWDDPNYKAYDNFSTHCFTDMFYNVQDVPPIVAGNETFFFCWPYMNSMATDAIKLYKPKRIIYVGEGYGGCTADDEFHTLLDDSYQEKAEIPIPKYEGIHDTFTVHELSNC